MAVAKKPAAKKAAPKAAAKAEPKKAEVKKPTAGAAYHLAKREDGLWAVKLTNSTKVIKTFEEKIDEVKEEIKKLESLPNQNKAQGKINDLNSQINKLNNGDNITIELSGDDVEVTRDMVDIRISAKETIKIINIIHIKKLYTII